MNKHPHDDRRSQDEVVDRSRIRLPNEVEDPSSRPRRRAAEIKAPTVYTEAPAPATVKRKGSSLADRVPLPTNAADEK